MGWLQMLLWFLANAPKLFSLAKQFMDIIHSKPFIERQAAKDELATAIKSGDPTTVAGVLHKHCSGIGCPTDLVRE